MPAHGSSKNLPSAEIAVNKDSKNQGKGVKAAVEGQEKGVTTAVEGQGKAVMDKQQWDAKERQ